MTVEVRKIRAGDPKHWSMRHSPGPKSSAGYGVFVDDEHVATISGETRGYRGHPQWIVETVGDWLAPVGQRPKRIYDTDSFAKAKAWALANEQVLAARPTTLHVSPADIAEARSRGKIQHATKRPPAQLQREIDEALSRRSAPTRHHHATRWTERNLKTRRELDTSGVTPDTEMDPFIRASIAKDAYESCEKEKANEVIAGIPPIVLGKTKYRVVYGNEERVTLIGPRGGTSHLIQSTNDPLGWAHNTMSGHTVKTVWYRRNPDFTFTRTS